MQKKKIFLSEKFIKQVSDLLKECNKRAEFDGDSFYARDFIRNAKINIEYLSSGERQLLYILSRVANTKDKPSFFLMDEPEISLTKLAGKTDSDNKKTKPTVSDYYSDSQSCYSYGWVYGLLC
ncbi:hypothetical protein ACLBOM_33105 [Escherichia coli]